MSVFAGNVCESVEVTTPVPQPETTLDTIAIVGGALGGVIVLLIIVITLFMYRRLRGCFQRHNAEDDYITAIPTMRDGLDGNPQYAGSEMCKSGFGDPGPQFHVQTSTLNAYNTMPGSSVSSESTGSFVDIQKQRSQKPMAPIPVEMKL